MLIGVDHGNKQIKTVHCNPFVSGLKQSVTRPFGQNVLRYQNTYYTLSTERIPYRKDKTEDDRFFILTLFALAGEIEARGAYSSEVQRIQLAVGLPPAHFGAQVERFTQYFGQRGMVEFEVQGKPYSIYIEDVACFPQAYAAAATMLHALVEEPKAVILDIGGFTADYLLMKNGEIDLTSCDSLENGVILLVLELHQIVRFTLADFTANREFHPAPKTLLFSCFPAIITSTIFRSNELKIVRKYFGNRVILGYSFSYETKSVSGILMCSCLSVSDGASFP